MIEYLLFRLESHLNKNGYKLVHTSAGIKILPIKPLLGIEPPSWYAPLRKSDPGASSRPHSPDCDDRSQSEMW